MSYSVSVGAATVSYVNRRKEKERAMLRNIAKFGTQSNWGPEREREKHISVVINLLLLLVLIGFRVSGSCSLVLFFTRCMGLHTEWYLECLWLVSFFFLCLCQLPVRFLCYLSIVILTTGSVALCVVQAFVVSYYYY